VCGDQSVRSLLIQVLSIDFKVLVTGDSMVCTWSHSQALPTGNQSHTVGGFYSVAMVGVAI